MLMKYDTMPGMKQELNKRQLLILGYFLAKKDAPLQQNWQVGFTSHANSNCLYGCLYFFVEKDAEVKAGLDGRREVMS